MTDHEIIKWFLLGTIAGGALASICWKTYVEDILAFYQRQINELSSNP